MAGVALVSGRTAPQTTPGTAPAGVGTMKWMLIAIIVGATTVGEVLQAMGMRKHGEIHDFRPGRVGPGDGACWRGTDS